MDESTLTRIIEGLLGLIMVIGAGLMKRVTGDIRALEKQSSECELSLERHKTHVAQNYAEKANIAVEIGALRQEQKESTSRLHDRIDTISDDIKLILQKVK